MTEVNFRLDGYWYTVRFDYDADLVRIVKSIPAFARSWKPETKTWRVDRYYAKRLAHDLEAYGCRITGLDPEDYRTRDKHNGKGADWAKLLFKLGAGRCSRPTAAGSCPYCRRRCGARRG